MEIVIRDVVPDDPLVAPTTRKRKATIGRRPKAEVKLSDAACTPEWLAAMLPVVDFDPCSNPRSHVRARWSWSLEKGFNGLKMPWRGSGFVNWPYSDPMPWAQKAIDELRIGRCTELIVLCKLDTSTDWWKVINGYVGEDSMSGSGSSPEIWTFDQRLQFDEHPALIEERKAERIAAGKAPGDGKSSNNFCSVIVHHRGDGSRLNLRSVATRWVRG